MESFSEVDIFIIKFALQYLKDNYEKSHIPISMPFIDFAMNKINTIEQDFNDIKKGTDKCTHII